jgi:hypothetical protein
MSAGPPGAAAAGGPGAGSGGPTGPRESSSDAPLLTRSAVSNRCSRLVRIAGHFWPPLPISQRFTGQALFSYSSAAVSMASPEPKCGPPMSHTSDIPASLIGDPPSTRTGVTTTLVRSSAAAGGPLLRHLWGVTSKGYRRAAHIVCSLHRHRRLRHEPATPARANNQPVATAIPATCIHVCQPKTVPSEPDGVGSGRRIMRKELNNPMSAASNGMSNAT